MIPRQEEPRMLKLINFFVVCRKCETDLRFDYLNQIRVCQCGEKLEIAPSVKRYLRNTYKKKRRINKKAV
jgi:hypothetical protein